MPWIDREEFLRRRAEFFQSPEWQEIREKAFKYHGRRCKVCGSRWKLEMNHMDYRRFGGNEWMTDLMPLCRTHHQSHTDYVFKEHKDEAAMYGESGMWHLSWWWYFETKRKIPHR